MQISVIVATYNSPVWLEKVLWGYAVQTRSDFELVIADDGSNEQTAAVIERLRQQTALAIRHTWHEDRGFRKCRILNLAAVAAAGDYLIFTDGDLIPRHDFVDAHASLAEEGCFLSGGCIRLPMPVSQQITLDDIAMRRATDPRWLAARRGLSFKQRLRLAVSGGAAGRMFDRLTTTRATWNGGNASTWKKHVLEANGFDERMEHGGLDREFGERLVNAGLRPRQIRHRAVCFHLDHGRPYADRQRLQLNLAIRRVTRSQRSVRTEFGIAQHGATRCDAA